MTGDLNRVALFVRVAEAGGVTAAAKVMKLPKSSVSRNLSQLESELGVELVVRGTRTFQLTPPGRSFFDAVASQIGAVEAAREDVRKEITEPRGKVRVLAPPHFAKWVFAPVITSFARRYPRVKVELSVGYASDPIARGFDIAVVIGQLTDSSAKVRSLGAVDGGIFASKGYLRTRGALRRPADLEKHDCVLTRATTPERWTLDGTDGTHSTWSVNGAVRVDDDSTAIAVAIADGGLVTVPLHFQQLDPMANALVRVLPDYTVRGERAQLVYPGSRHLPSRISLLCESLLEVTTTTCPKASQR